MRYSVFIFLLVAYKNVQTVPCNCGLGSGVDVCSGRRAGGTFTLGLGSQGRSGDLVGDGDGDGDDVSNIYIEGGGIRPSGCFPQVVRPRTLPLIPLHVKPIGNLCSCGRTIVKPAHVPRPACGYCSGGGGSGGGGPGSGTGSGTGPGIYPPGSTSTNTGTLEQILTPGQILQSGPFSIDFPGCGLPTVQINRPPSSSAPADAVSLDIAQRRFQSHNYQQADRKLSFGFAKSPQEVSCHVTKRRFPEGNYQDVKGPILALQFTGSETSPDDEELELLAAQDDEEEQIDAVPEARRPTLDEMGYAEVNDKPGKFIDLGDTRQPIVISTDGEGVDSLGANIAPCKDGYENGQVIIKEGGVNSDYSEISSQGQLHPAACADDDDDDDRGSGPPYYEFPPYSAHNPNTFYQHGGC